jgi:hypothetical protein
MEVLNFLLFIAALVVPMAIAWVIVCRSSTNDQPRHERKARR